MKKSLISLIAVVFASTAFAGGNIVPHDPTTNTIGTSSLKWGTVYCGQVIGDSFSNLTAGIAGTSIVVQTASVGTTLSVGSTITATTNITSLGRGMVTAPGATGWMVDKGTNLAPFITGTATNTFATAFSQIPVVMYSYTSEGVIASNMPTVTATGFTIPNCQTGFTWMAIGTRPY